MASLMAPPEMLTSPRSMDAAGDEGALGDVVVGQEDVAAAVFDHADGGCR